MADVLLEGLTDEQRDAVTTVADPLCIIAGAGSGKTRVLTHRIAWQAEQGNLDPRRVLALTFTRRAAAELRARTRALGMRDAVAAGTFHAAALAVLRRHWEHTGRRPPTLLDRRMAFLARAHPRLDRAAVADLDAEIGWARARLVTPERYAEEAAAAGRRPPRGAAFTAEAYADYAAAKRSRRLVDFDDVLALCHRVLRADDEFAAAQRWRHRHLFVDEFQDVNPLQFALLQAWTGPQSTLVVVGDPDQAIYAWNGAEPDLIRDIDTHLPGVAVVHLRTNFRSTPEILGTAARILDRDPQPAARFRGDEPTLTVVDTHDGEPTAVARAVRARHRPGAPWRHQAVLARTNAQLPAVKRALDAAGIPSRSRGDGALLRRPEVLDLLDRWTPTARLETVLADSLVADDLDSERAAMIETFVALARDHLALDPEATVAGFVAALRSDDRMGSVGDAVELVTFHAAKGLEWPIVHLVGLEDGLVPIAHARDRAARAEERRLLYVAATRAQRELHATWCTRRTVGDRVVERSPSPWAEAFGAEQPGEDDPEPDGPPIGDLRARLGGEAPVIDLAAIDAEAVRTALDAWRAHAADAARVAPGAVLSDETLRRIGELRPSTIDELAAVSGVGPGKARRFGPALLDIVAG